MLHQILQWHHMLTSEGSYPAATVAGLETNTLADGLFHAAAWILSAVGAWLLWRACRHGDVGSGRVLVGWAVVGWGVFNLVEGLVDHQLLGIHHVREGAGHETAYDLAFLALSAALALVGWSLTRSRER